MKKDLSVTILFGLLIITVIFTVCAMDSHQQQIDQLKQPQHTEITKVEPLMVAVDGALVERLEELLLENLLLEQELKDLRHQVREFGWLKPQMDKEGVNP